jgi:hypothetical protein
MPRLFLVKLTKLPDALLLDGRVKGFGYQTTQKLEQILSGILIRTRKWSDCADQWNSFLSNVWSGHKDIRIRPIVPSPRPVKYNQLLRR